MTPGTSQTFSVVASDAANDALTYRWTYDVTDVATGTSYSRTFDATGTGLHTLGISVSGPGGTTLRRIGVLVIPLDHLVLSPSSTTVNLGGSQSYTAEGFDAHSNDLGDFTAATTFTISPDGSCISTVCTPANPGPHTVTGRDGTASGTSTLTVAAPDHLVLSPASAVTTVGGSQTYTAERFDSHDNDLGDVTAATTFTISSDGSCVGTVCTPAGAGPHTVTGSAGTARGTATLTVDGPLNHIVVSPASATIAAGGSKTYKAEGFDQLNDDLGDVTAATTFAISPDGSCTTNTCTATKTGAHTVTGTDGVVKGTAALNIAAGPLAYLTISPSTGSVPACTAHVLLGGGVRSVQQ